MTFSTQRDFTRWSRPSTTSIDNGPPLGQGDSLFKNSFVAKYYGLWISSKACASHIPIISGIAHVDIRWMPALRRCTLAWDGTHDSLQAVYALPRIGWMHHLNAVSTPLCRESRSSRSMRFSRSKVVTVLILTFLYPLLLDHDDGLKTFNA